MNIKKYNIRGDIGQPLSQLSLTLVSYRLTIRKIKLYYTHLKRRGIEQLAARQAHNLEVPGSSPGPATNKKASHIVRSFFVLLSSVCFLFHHHLAVA